MSDDTLFSCPCCTLPTLETQGGFDICPVCWWEDDGQGDDDANDVRGGPNEAYSLAAARFNFRHHGDMYDAGEGIDVVKHPSPAREALRDYALSVIRQERELVVADLEALIEAEEKLRTSTLDET